MPSRASCVALALLAVGCESPGPSGLARDELPPELARATCALLFECCTSSELSTFTPGLSMPITTEQECRAYFEERASSFATASAGPIAAGQIAWDAAAAADCVASIDAAECSGIPDAIARPPLWLPPAEGPCERVLVPLRTAGQECGTPLVCTSGVCGADGLCARAAAEGEPCDVACEDGLFCHLAAADPRCRALIADGGACSPGDDGTCESRYCDAGTCAPRPSLRICDGL